MYIALSFLAKLASLFCAIKYYNKMKLGKII